PKLSSYGRGRFGTGGTVVMLSGTSGSIAGLKIPCGPRKGTRTPSNSNPFSRTARGSGESPWICLRSASTAKARSRTAASTASTTEDVLVVPAKQVGVRDVGAHGRADDSWAPAAKKAPRTVVYAPARDHPRAV